MMPAATDVGVTDAQRVGFVGSRTAKLQGGRFLTGRTEYLADIELPGMAYAAVLRSPHPHALIRRIDGTKARALPGVFAVLTGEDAAALSDPIPPRIEPDRLGAKQTTSRCLAVGKAVYAGQPVAALVAETASAARAALGSIEVEYERLAHVLDADAALAPDAPVINEGWGDNVLLTSSFVEGDVDAGFAAAAYTLEGEVVIQRYSSQPIETRGYVACWDQRNESYVLHATSQNPHQLRWMLARSLRVDEQKIRVIVPALGGGFGLKLCGHPEETLVCVLSRVAQRPVKWIEDRSECLLIGAREQAHRFTVGFESDGTILALRDHFVTNVGAIGPASGWGMSFLTALTFPGGYRIPATDIKATAVTTNKGTWNASRGYGKEATTLVLERIVDLVARQLGADPAEVRRRNFVRKDEFPYKTNSGLNIDSGDYHAALDKVLRLVDYDAVRVEQKRMRGVGRYLGVGIAFELTPEAADIPGALVGGYDTATVRLDPSGNVVVLTGVTSSGSGNDTGIAQIVADEVGIPAEHITVVQGDTAMCPYGFGNSSGRSMVTGGSAAALAARDIREKLELVAAELLDASPPDLRFGEGKIVDERSGRSISVEDVAYTIYTNAFGIASIVDPPLESTRVYKPGNTSHVPDERGRIQPYPTYSNAVHVAIVEVDSETGKVELQRLACTHDCGTMVNPMLVEGQMHGAMAMGVGAALMEDLVYGDDGTLRTDRLKSYLMPRALDLPSLEVEHQVTPSPFTLLGTKGAGEAGVGGAQAAVANAVEDALAPFGVTVTRLPLSAPTVLQLIRRAASPL
jgi:carbon-monoxide dehydrogenase large subunit